MIKRHPVYPYNICHNGAIMENGFADVISGFKFKLVTDSDPLELSWLSHRIDFGGISVAGSSS